MWTGLAALKADPAHLKPTLLYAAGPKEALEDTTTTQGTLLLTVLNNVKGRISVYTPTKAGFSRVKLALPDNAALRVGDADDQGDRAFIDVTSFLTPTSLWLTDTGTGELKKIKAIPPKFDAVVRRCGRAVQRRRERHIGAVLRRPPP